MLYVLGSDLNLFQQFVLLSFQFEFQNFFVVQLSGVISSVSNVRLFCVLHVKWISLEFSFKKILAIVFWPDCPVKVLSYRTLTWEWSRVLIRFVTHKLLQLLSPVSNIDSILYTADHETITWWGLFHHLITVVSMSIRSYVILLLWVLEWSSHYWLWHARERCLICLCQSSCSCCVGVMKKSGFHLQLLASFMAGNLKRIRGDDSGPQQICLQ